MNFVPVAFSMPTVRIWSSCFDPVPPIFILFGPADLTAAMYSLAVLYGFSALTQRTNWSSAIIETGVMSLHLNGTPVAIGVVNRFDRVMMILCGSPLASLTSSSSSPRGRRTRPAWSAPRLRPARRDTLQGLRRRRARSANGGRTAWWWSSCLLADVGARLGAWLESCRAWHGQRNRWRGSAARTIGSYGGASTWFSLPAGTAANAASAAATIASRSKRPATPTR